MNLYITGASGFAGTNLLPYLQERQFNCKNADRAALNQITAGSLKGSQIVIHLAGKAHDLKKVSNPEEYYQVNYELTKKLYDAFLDSDATRFIFISSVKAAADRVNGILTENMPPCPQTDYGKSKLMAEQYIESKPLPAGKSYYILRPCMIHGPGNKGNLNLLFQLVKKGIPYPLAAFNNKRSFLSIENLCFIINTLIIENNIDSGIYHVADNEPLSTNQVIAILAKAINKKPMLWKIAPGLIRSVAKLGNILHLPLTTERLEKLTESYVVSNDKIRSAIGMDLPLTASKGLEITAASFASM